MEITIRQFAEDQKVSYEAVRSQIGRYEEELSGHIFQRGKTRYLDEWACDFLSRKRKENTIFIVEPDAETVSDLKDQIEELKQKLMDAQNKMMKMQEETVAAQKMVIDLKDKVTEGIEDRIRCKVLTEDNESKKKQLEESEQKIRESEQKIREAEDRIREAEDRIREAEQERDQARAEAESFTKSIFGLYRKK